MFLLTLRHRRDTQELIKDVKKPILIGTWKAADWAIRFYEKHGFRLVEEEEKDRLLRKYWAIPDRQVATSVVLVDGKYKGSDFQKSDEEEICVT